MNRKLRLLSAAALAMALPAVSIAAVPSQLEVVSVKVSYQGLDIHSTAGAKVLYRRLKAAAEQACDVMPYSTIRSLSVLSESRACYKQALSTAVTKIDSDALARLHQEKSRS